MREFKIKTLDVI